MESFTREGQPWERLLEPGKNGKKESARNYDAFLTYCMLGPQRSIAKAAKLLRKSVKLLERWSAKYRWRERAEAWDQFLQEHYQAVALKEYNVETELWFQRKRQVREDRFRTYEKISRRTDEMLDVPIALPDDDLEAPPAGKRSRRPVRWSMDSVARLIRAANELAESAINGDNGIEIEEIDNYDNVIPLRSNSDKNSGDDESDDNVWNDDESE